jgi:phosphoribosylglycinamide formyltransferase-1
MINKKIAIFASGSGSNAENIGRYFRNHPKITVSLILSNKEDAPVHKRAAELGIPSISFNREEFYNSNKIIEILQEHKIDFIVLAGFLWLIPQNLIRAFPGKIINIHPALLPSYGGKGMYGMKVHSSVIENGETESGITIHYVNEDYDEGNIIFQARCPVSANDTPELLAEKIHKLEYKHFPEVIKELVEAL